MTMVVNGSKVLSHGYEFAVETSAGNIIPCDCLEDARDLVNNTKGAKVIFRAVYVTSWIDTI